MGSFKHNKNLGQHFLEDNAVLQQIIAWIAPNEIDSILEIGAGSGSLTEKLLEFKKPLLAVEIDKRWANLLKKKFEFNQNFSLECEDILKLDWNLLPLLKSKKNCLVGNIPYSISTPLFFKILANLDLFDSFIIMFQKEFGDRLIGDKKKSKKNFGSLAVLTKLYFSLEQSKFVSRNCFKPKPKVDSIILKIKKKSFSLQNQQQFFRFLSKIFQQPRQTILNNIKQNLKEFYQKMSEQKKKELLNVRPADLSAQEILELFNIYIN